VRMLVTMVFPNMNRCPKARGQVHALLTVCLYSLGCRSGRLLRLPCPLDKNRFKGLVSRAIGGIARDAGRETRPHTAATLHNCFFPLVCAVAAVIVVKKAKSIGVSVLEMPKCQRETPKRQHFGVGNASRTLVERRF